MKIKLKLFKLANKLFERYHFIYKPLYFFYKNISDRQKIALFKNIIKPGMRVLDLGANIGFYTVLFSKLVGENGKVFSFEPDVKNYEYLEENTKTLYNVIIEKKAVSDKTGKINFFISKDLNVDHQSYDSGEGRDYEEADAIALDDYFLDNTKIDFIKIDIQGYEPIALKGMSKIIRQPGRTVVFGELWPYGLQKAGSSAEEYLQFLKSHGFKIKFFEGEIDYNEKLKDKDFYTDFIAIKD
ncbi:MAG: FkbM family methyltransferase [Patescibacteria group bacterium]